MRVKTGLSASIGAGLCALMAIPLPALGQALSFDTLETRDLLLLNLSTNDPELKSYAAKVYLNAADYHRKKFGWEPSEQVTFLFLDFEDAGNASATTLSRLLVTSQSAPADKTFESFPPIDQIYGLMNHEVAHLATLGTGGQSERFWSGFFSGKPNLSSTHPLTIGYTYLVAPRELTPRWWGEGIATFMDTWMTGGIGRAQGGFDEMVFRAMVRDGTPFYSNLAVASVGAKLDFNTGTNAYLYGTRFMTYLAYRYSPEKLLDWFRRDPSSKRYYADQFAQVFGESLESVWQQWITFEHDYQTKNLAELRVYPLTQGETVTAEPVGWISRMFLDETSNRLIGGLMYPGVVAHLGTVPLGDGERQNLHDIKGPMKYMVTSTAWDPDARRLFFTEDNAEWRDLRYLDLATGQIATIAKDARIGSLAFNRKDKSLWGVKHSGGSLTLVAMPAPYEKLIEIYRAPYGQIISDLDISGDGAYLAATVGDRQGGQVLQVFRIDDAALGDEVAKFDFGRAYPENFVFSPDGKYLYGSAYYTGVSNIFRFELQTGQIEAITNAETGFFRPIPLADGSLIVFEYTGAGFRPMRLSNAQPLQDLGTIRFLGNELVKKFPEVATWGAGDPASIDLESQVVSREPYVPWKRIKHESSYPILEAYKTKPALGYSFNWSDPIQLETARLDVSYSPDDSLADSEKLHVDAQYRHKLTRGSVTLRYRHNDADFYDLFGPTRRSRKGDSVVLKYDRNVIFDVPRRLDFKADVGYFKNLDTLPVNQNAQILIDQLWSGGFGWDYSNTYKSQGAAVDEKGLRSTLRAEVDSAASSHYPKLRGGVDLGFALPLKHASIWLYNSVGVADGDPGDLLTNFYFGGFGNNYVDNGSAKRYRDYDSMPGFEIGEISAKRFAKIMTEFNTPPIRLAEVGTPGFYLGEIQPSLFAGTLFTDSGSSAQQRFHSLGLQFDLSLNLLHRLSITVSLGYARGFAEGGDDSDEYMLSLKIL